MPQYLITIEAEGIGYPFLLEASERGRAIAHIKRYWEEQDWGAYDALRIELEKKNREGIFRPVRLNPQVYSRVQALVHNCLLDMQEGQVDRDHVLRQLGYVLTEVLPASIAHEVFEIVAAHERAGRPLSLLKPCVRCSQPQRGCSHKRRWPMWQKVNVRERAISVERACMLWTHPAADPLWVSFCAASTMP